MKPPLTPLMIETIAKAKEHGKAILVRWPGGYWTFRGAAESTHSASIPAWWVGASTVYGIVARGCGVVEERMPDGTTPKIVRVS
jgi:hypothetical protein